MPLFSQNTRLLSRMCIVTVLIPLFPAAHAVACFEKPVNPQASQNTGTLPPQPSQTEEILEPPVSPVPLEPPRTKLHNSDEYHAYMAAFRSADPVSKARGMEDFLVRYPQSEMKIQALEQALAAYQQSLNQVKLEDAAQRLLQADTSNVRAMSILAFLKRTYATQGAVWMPEGYTDEVLKLGRQGLNALSNWQRPASMPDIDFQRLRNQMTEIFAGAAGFGLLQKKDYAGARSYFQKSLQIDPGSVQDNYQMAIAHLESDPIEPNGFWYCGKAIRLTQKQGNPASASLIQNYCNAKYRKYTGTPEGIDNIVASAGNETAPAADFAQKIPKSDVAAGKKDRVIQEVTVIAPPNMKFPAAKRSACELAVDAVQKNDPHQLSFSDWEYVLSLRDCSPANKNAAEKVWASIQSLQTRKGHTALLKIPAKVISANQYGILAAITPENQKANKADVHISVEHMEKIPSPGAMINVIGSITEYRAFPIMLLMEHSSIEKTGS